MQYTQMPFRQLEAKLRLAYVNKERAAQLEERKLAREIGKRDKEVCVLLSFCKILQHDHYFYVYTVVGNLAVH